MVFFSVALICPLLIQVNLSAFHVHLVNYFLFCVLFKKFYLIMKIHSSIFLPESSIGNKLDVSSPQMDFRNTLFSVAGLEFNLYPSQNYSPWKGETKSTPLRTMVADFTLYGTNDVSCCICQKHDPCKSVQVGPGREPSPIRLFLH